ncbi:MAG: winged helix-turn-helix transcriptional regulator [Methanomicrobium sp.]|nr:winged helix-turn-helix transcriptional regulator [Methanomicrobium sp.]
MEGDSDIVLDSDDLAALSSKTRIAILKAIDKKDSTITELAEELGISKASVHAHVAELESSGLIEADKVRKWHPYSLTKKGRQILHPHKNTRVVIMLGLIVFCMTAGIYSFVLYFEGFVYQGGASSADHPLIFLMFGDIFALIAFCLIVMMIKPLFKNEPSDFADEE